MILNFKKNSGILTKVATDAIALEYFQLGLSFLAFYECSMKEIKFKNEEYKYTPTALTAVQAHILAQSLELMLKAALLKIDFKKYYKIMGDKEKLGHNLIKIFEALKIQSPEFEIDIEEISKISKIYNQADKRSFRDKHSFRYPNPFKLIFEDSYSESYESYAQVLYKTNKDIFEYLTTSEKFFKSS